VTAIHAGHVIGAETADVISTKASNAIAAEAAHVSSTEATHVSSTEAAHVASAEAATTVPSATAAAAAAGLRTRGKKAAGKHCACQNHHHSSSHDILHWDGRTFRHRLLPDAGVLRTNADVAMDWRWDCWFAVSTKFPFSQSELNVRRGAHQT
jgi:hypothetical protein